VVHAVFSNKDINALNIFCFKSLLCHYAKSLTSQWPVVKRSCASLIQILELWCHVLYQFVITFIDETKIRIRIEINSIGKFMFPFKQIHAFARR
jgi:hypothetical protein